ncbi:hypothetical protein GOP47_0021781 [Adiantum capillus-veneris]|uniref:adenylate kinase n=1 Tax=Adiantum capillus-veneris TaxID=13818 RepID=A0A9D4Z6J3_ADICA|nr:hypothetical protein GOP47_0021781 [Adiantum capillus-veneris]
MAAASLSSLLTPSTEPKISSSSSPSSFLHFSATPSQLHSSLPSSLKASSSFKNAHSKRSPVFHMTQVSAELSKAHKPLKVMISGAPASGKGTQCELIVKNHDLVHVSAGDLLRAEVAAGTENGKRAKEYMTKGELVPNEIIVNMVKERLNQPDAQQKGWLLDGYPRSKSQADAIEATGLRPDVFILLEVPDDVLIDRVVGRRLDPVAGKIYHLKFSPPETKEIADRLTQRFDDTEYQQPALYQCIHTLVWSELGLCTVSARHGPQFLFLWFVAGQVEWHYTLPQAKLRLQTHSQNVDAVLAIYNDILRRIDGNRPKEDVFWDINDVLLELSDDSVKAGFFPLKRSASVEVHSFSHLMIFKRLPVCQ